MIEAAPAAEEPGRYPVEITLAPADWQRLNAAGQAGLGEATAAAGGAGASTAYRLGLIAWRVAGLLTVLRCYENGEAPTGRLLADPADVGTALAIMDTARAHALAVLASLPTPSGTAGRYATKAGQEARAQELHAQGLGVREIAQQVGVHFTTVARWLRDM